MKNFIRIDNIDTPVYRIMPLHRLGELFKNRELVLVRPKLWDDPFENFFLKSTFLLQDGTEVSADKIADSWYGQCWTTNSDTDAMWRIYSQDKQSLRIKTTIRKLADAMWDKNDAHSSSKYHIGSVAYKPVSEIDDFRKNTGFMELTMGAGTSRLAETLLTKRQEFSHESEIRLLYFDTENNSHLKQANIHPIHVDPTSLIDEVCIDPRIDDAIDIEALTKKIRRLGFSGSITQSTLYQFEPARVPPSPTP
ncbi:MAG: DUF2971 domain-containing protein [Verrucomicrobiales bacterium]